MKISQSQIYTGHKGSIFSICLEATTHTLYSAADDGLLVSWHLDTIKSTGKALMRVDHGIYSLCLLTSIGCIAVGTSQGVLYIIDLSSKKIIRQFNLEQLAVYSLHEDPDQKRLWVLHAKGKLNILSLEDFSWVHRHDLSKNNLRSMVIDPSRSKVYIGSSDHSIHVLERESWEKVHEWNAHQNSVFSLGISPDRKRLLSGGRDAYLNSWDLENQYNSLQQIPAHNFTINHISYSPSGRLFATASRDKTIKIWDSNQLKLLKVFDPIRNEGHRHSVNKVLWYSEDSLLSASDDKRIIHWQIENNE